MSEPKPTPKEVLQQKGLRYSQPREAILSYFMEQAKHASAEGLHQTLRARGEHLSLSTVYLNLGVLKEAGLIREFSGANGEALFDSNVAPHYHLICERSGKILDVPAIEVAGKPLSLYIKEQVEAATGWQVREPDISLIGLSPDEV